MVVRAYSPPRGRSYTRGMSAAYSLDLRERVVAAVDEGMSKMEASRTFRIARTTLDDWLLLREQQGHLVPKAYERRGPLPKIGDLEAFESFAVRHEGCTLAQMQSAWQEETGQRVSDQTLSTTLKKIVWTRKKRVLSSPSD